MSPIPFSAQSKTLAIAGTSIASTSQALPGQGSIIRLLNEGPNNCYISIGGGTQIAVLPPTVTPLPTATAVAAGEDVVFSIPNDQVYNISIICRASASCTLLVSVGEGL